MVTIPAGSLPSPIDKDFTMASDLTRRRVSRPAATLLLLAGFVAVAAAPAWAAQPTKAATMGRSRAGRMSIDASFLKKGRFGHATRQGAGLRSWV
jgi:hypothetical protein